MTKLSARGTINLRTTPGFETNVLTTIPNGRVFEGNSDGEWWEVKAYVHDSVVQRILPPPPMPEGNIPYVSQWDNEANQRGADCGQTCCIMLARSKGITKYDVNDLPFQQNVKGITNSNDLVKNFNFMGLPALSVALLPGAVPNKGAICLVQYSGFLRENVQDKGYLLGHWVVFLENQPDYVVVHDPDWSGIRRNEGAFKRYSQAEWQRAFIPSGSTHRTAVELI